MPAIVRFRRWILLFVLLAAACGCGAAAAQAGGAAATHPMWVTNWGSSDVSVFHVNANGIVAGPTLVKVPAGAQNPLAAAYSARRRRLYVSDWGSGDVSSFAVSRDGGLKAVGRWMPASPLPTNSAGIAVSPASTELFLANFNGGKAGSLSTFAIGRDGDLRPLGATVPSGGRGSAGVTVDRAGRNLYVANMGSGDVSRFQIGDGRPRLRQVVVTGAGAFYPALTPDGRYLLVANASADTVTSIPVARGGGLGAVRSTVSTGAAGPRGLAIAPDGAHAYAAHFNAGTGTGSVSVLRISPRGKLSLQGKPLATGSNGAEAIALDETGHRLYVANFNTDGPGSVTTFAVDAHGGLERLGDPIPTGGRQPDFGGLVIGSAGV